MTDPHVPLLPPPAASESESERERSDRLNQIATRLPGMIYQYRLRPDGSSCFPYASEAIRNIYGVSPEEVREDASAVFSRLHLDDLEEVRASISRSAATLEPCRCEYRVRSDDGAIRWLDGNAIPQREPDGSILWHGFITDVTEKKELIHALKRESEKSRVLLRAASDGVTIMDENATVVEVSDSFCAMLGYSRDEMIGMNVAQWDCGFSSDALMVAFRRQFKEATRSEFETRHRRKDGSTFDVEISGYPVELDGRPYLFNSSRDISARKQSERQLVEAEHHYRSLANGLTTLIWRSGTDRLCHYFNDSWLRFTGRTLEQELGDGWAEGVHPEDLPRCVKTYVEAFERRERFSMDYRLRHADGTYHWISDDGAPEFDSQGVFAGYIGACTDITARKQAEAELERHRSDLEALVDERTMALLTAKEAAEAASRAKSTFLATMSHELRTPLNAIMGLTYLAQERATDPKQAEQLGKVKLASSHLLRIISDILDISKIEADRFHLDPTDFALEGLLERVDALTRGEATTSGLHLLFEVAPELRGLVVHGDPQRLTQILLNLIGNALKFTPRGSVGVGARLVERAEAGLLLRFDVEDTGIGIALADVRRIFNSFEQVDSSRSRKYGGVGLGLAITRKLVEAMGGSIGVESEPGVGSRFWFTVRLLEAGHPASSPTPLPSARMQLRARHADAYVLIAEDDALNREVTQGLLEEAGLVVQFAPDGAVAVQMAKRVNYDLILMDLQMPEMDGLEATRRIRALPNGRDVPIIALTSNVFADDRAQCHAAGTNDFLGRPVDAEQLFATLLRWLDGAAESGDGGVRGPPR